MGLVGHIWRVRGGKHHFLRMQAAAERRLCHTRWVEGITASCLLTHGVVRCVSHGQAYLLEGCLVHVFEKLVLLGQLIFKHQHLRVDFAVLVPQGIDLDLSLHILLVEIFA